MNQCPDPAVLARYVTGDLDEAPADALAGHLESCAACQNRIDSLTNDADSLVEALRKSPADIDTRYEPQLEQMMAEARNLRWPRSNKLHRGVALKTKSPPRPQGALGTEVFISCLRKSGLIEPEEVEALAEEIRPPSGDSFARELIARSRITPFQARALLRGKWKGLVLGNYIVTERLGAGGMGSVFKAKHRRLGRTVCIKVLRNTGRKSPEMVERFRREAKTVAALDHPNFVVAHDADEADGIPFLVMEFIEGRDLGRVIADDGPVTVKQAVAMIRQVAVALDYAHRQGMVHRDIKPHNLLLRVESGELSVESSATDDERALGVSQLSTLNSQSVKILDMGLARFDSLLGENADAITHASMTATGVVMGTVDYMAPEQALNSRHADARSDVYSLGCTLFYLLTGRPPFEGETLMEKLIAHREQEAPDLKGVDREIPPAMNAIFQHMVSKNPERRYNSMAALVDDLDAFRAGRKPLAMRASSRMRAFGNRTILITVAALVLAIAAGLGLAFGIDWEKEDDPSPGQSIGSKSKSLASSPKKREPVKPPIQGHPRTLFNGGPGRVLLVMPYGGFYEDHYQAVTKSLAKRGIDMVTGSWRSGYAHPKHHKIGKVKVDMTLNKFQVDDFDAVVFIGGYVDEFKKYDKDRPVSDKTKAAVNQMLDRGRAVASVGNGIDILHHTGAKDGCKFHKQDECYVGTAKHRPGYVVTVGESKHADRMVALLFDDLLRKSSKDNR